MPNDFEAFAKTALGTDDPERLAAFKEAVMACYDSGEETEEMAPESGEGGEKGGISLLFPAKK